MMPRAERRGWRRLVNGATFISNGGAFLEMKVYGQRPGATIKAARGDKLVVETGASINLDYDALGVVEVVRQGEVVKAFRPDEGSSSTLKARVAIPVEGSRWIAGRAFGKTESRHSEEGVKRFSTAHTGAIYVEVAGRAVWTGSNMEKELAGAFAELDRLAELARGDASLMKILCAAPLEIVERARKHYEELGERAKKAPGVFTGG